MINVLDLIVYKSCFMFNTIIQIWIIALNWKRFFRIICLFASASHQTGLDTRSMTQRSIKVGIRGGGGQVRA